MSVFLRPDNPEYTSRLIELLTQITKRTLMNQLSNDEKQYSDRTLKNHPAKNLLDGMNLGAAQRLRRMFPI